MERKPKRDEAHRIDQIAVIAKMGNGKFHQIRIAKDDKNSILRVIVELTESGSIELIQDEIEGITF